MAQESMEIALIKYNKKTWSKSALLGLFVGLAVIVPGISGSTVAIIFKLYDQFLYALGNLFKQFKKCFFFLLPIAIGIGVGVLLGFVAVKKLLELLPFAIVCLFAGLMLGAFPAVKDELKGAKKTPLLVALFCLGLAIPVALGCFSALATIGGTVSQDIFSKINVWQVLLAVVVGGVMATTQIVPGLSASAFLMAIGWFASVVDSVSFSYWQANPQIFFVYFALAIGFLAGLLGFSKVLTNLFSKARHTAYSMIVGLSLGSIFSMFCNGDVVEVYLSWANGTSQTLVLDVVLGAVFLIAGSIGAYLLVRYERKKAELDRERETKTSE
jgi:putative membrane protein